MTGRRSALLVLAGLAAAPLAFSKLRHYLSPSAPALLTRHKEPRDIGAIGFRDEDDKPLGLADFRAPFLLNIWATWCPPCREEMPSLDRLAARLDSDPGLGIIALSVDRVSFAQLRAFYTSYNITHLKLYRGEEAGVLDALRVPGLPTTLLLDASRRETARLVGPTDWDSPAIRGQLGSIVPALRLSGEPAVRQ
jgi:thiol-disulfide isomerase/thioredoxin